MRIFGTPNPCKGEQGIKISTLVSWKWYIGPKDGHHRVLPSPLERHSDHPEWEPPLPVNLGWQGHWPGPQVPVLGSCTRPAASTRAVGWRSLG